MRRQPEEKEITRARANPEGQFFERKSAFDRAGGRIRARKAASVARDVVETLAAMANADGGELVLGIEDDGTITGVPHPADKVALFMRAPRDRNYVIPALPCRSSEVRTSDGLLLLHFVVEWSPNVHRLADSRTLLRINDSNQPFAADQIAALKQTKAQGLFERSFPAGATMGDVDLDLVSDIMHRMEIEEQAEGFLRRYRLIEPRNGTSVPCLACLLLFGKDPGRWHPRCGIDFVRWEGTERKHGAELNITKRIRIDHPLAVLPEKAYEAIRPFIRERQRLHDLFFTERLEYPTFVWQEAIVNAVAHRDYSIQGVSIEVWMFDDHIEVRSPGLPPRPASIEALNRREHIHVSRNPLIVRLLADLGYMRDLGEGIPRMFAEMEREGFYPPRFDDIAGVSFQATLRNEPIYDEATLEWLARFRHLGLTGDQKRLLAYARAHGSRFTSREYQKLTGLDIYGASSSIKDLVRRGLARSTGKGSRVYEMVEKAPEAVPAPPELRQLLPALRRKGFVRNSDVCERLGLGPKTALRLLERLVAEGWLARTGQKRGTRYSLQRSL